jgi:hypothetical protein
MRVQGLSSEVELVLLALFTEASVQDAERVLSKGYACPDPSAAIAAALAGLRGA